LCGAFGAFPKRQAILFRAAAKPVARNGDCDNDCPNLDQYQRTGHSGDVAIGVATVVTNNHTGE
jgi:hypothetical protein